MKKHFSTPGLITIAILTVITAVFWTFFSVLRIFMTKEEDTKVPDYIITSLNPQLNSNALDSISSRKYIEESQIPEITYSESEEPTPEPEVVEEEVVEEEVVQEEVSPTNSPPPTQAPNEPSI